MINGLVDTPLCLPMPILSVSRVKTMCISANVLPIRAWNGRVRSLTVSQFTHGMIHNMEYTGVPLRALLNEAGLGAAGDLKDKWVYVEGADASSNGRSIPMEKALDDVLLRSKPTAKHCEWSTAIPVRLVVPGWEGNMWVKWIRRIEVSDAHVKAAKKLRNTPTFWKTAPRANGRG